MIAIYGADLALVHHAGFGRHARGMTPGILALLRRARIRSGLVVDLACGSGIGARELSRAGYDVLGVDASAAMIRLARKNAPRARFVRASLHEVELPRCDAITVVGEGLCYLGARNPPLERFFRRAARALRPGGLLVFDALVASRERGMAYSLWRSGEDWAIGVEVSEDETRSVLRREITTFVRAGRGWRRSKETHRLRVLDRDAVLGSLRRAGFAASSSPRLGAFRLPPRRVAFVARRHPEFRSGRPSSRVRGGRV